MRRLADKSLVPPDDFRYTDPDTGWTITAKTHMDWVDNAKIHRRANNLTVPPDMVGRMEDQLCGLIPPQWCEREAGDVTTWVDTRFSWDDVKAGMAVFGHWASLGMPLVSQVEADRRAAVCVSCPLNVNIAGCAACLKMASLITGAVAQKKGTYDDRLRACAVCHCALKAKTWFPMDILESRDGEADRQRLYPDFCWLKQGGENYRS